MLLFKKKDLLVVISKSGETVQFTKPLKDILKYQHRYNYKFKMYENGKITVADDYIIEGETLTVLFGSASVSYTSEGASYTEGSSDGDGGEGGEVQTKHIVYIEGYASLQISSELSNATIDLFDSNNTRINYIIDGLDSTLNDVIALLQNSNESNVSILCIDQHPASNNRIYFGGYNIGFGTDYQYCELIYYLLSGVTDSITTEVQVNFSMYI